MIEVAESSLTKAFRQKQRDFVALKSNLMERDYLRLSTTDVSDALDELGIRGASRGIFPLWPGCPKVAGRATTMRLIPKGGRSPVTGTLDAIMAADPGDILVIDHEGRTDVNSWGGLATFTAARRRLAGVVIDGVTRDIHEIRKWRYPVFGKGIIQQSVRGRCAFGGVNVTANLGGVVVHPRDLVMGDSNGVVVVPRKEIREVLRLAKQAAQTNETIRKSIDKEMDPVHAHRRANYERHRDARS